MEALGSSWEQGQHMTLLGRNGSGKTTAAIQILDQWDYVVALLTKRNDDLFPLFRKRGYHMLRPGKEWPAVEAAPKVAVHLPPEGLGRAETAKQSSQIRDVLAKVWEQGKWTLYIDEIAQLSDLGGLSTELRSLWKEARSSDVTIVAGTQRPSRVPIEAYSQPRFLCLWRTNDADQQKRLGEMNAIDPMPVRMKVGELGRFQILVVDTYTDDMAITQPPKLK